MIAKTVYVANDGKQFDTEAQCLTYEKACQMYRKFRAHVGQAIIDDQYEFSERAILWVAENYNITEKS